MRSRRKTPSGFLRLQPADSSDKTLPEGKRLRQRLTEYGVRPRKRWGQNFLIRDQIAERIVDASRVQDDQVVVEIGPGTGALTGHLAARARKVVAIEKDRRLAALLRDDLGDWSKIKILESDFLEVDLNALALEEDVESLTIVGNIPYSITTPILTRLIESRDVLESALVLVQREYALRLAAAAGTPDYGSLTVYARFFLTLDPLFVVPPSAFWPRPEVESRLIRIRFRRRPPIHIPDETRFFALVRAGFGQRRKTLANALADAYDGDKPLAGRVLKAAGIAPGRRGETLDLEEFGQLARADKKVRDHDQRD